MRQLNIFLFCLLLLFAFSLLKGCSLAFRGLFFCVVSWSLALIFLSQAWIYPQSVQLPPNDGNQFSQEIRTSMTSTASSSRLIRPIWTTDKSKRFLPLVPSAEIPLKICSCLLQSVPQFFYWWSFFFFLVVVVSGVGWGGGVDKGMCSLGAMCGTWMMSVPG